MELILCSKWNQFPQTALWRLSPIASLSVSSTLPHKSWGWGLDPPCPGMIYLLYEPDLVGCALDFLAYPSYLAYSSLSARWFMSSGSSISAYYTLSRTCAQQLMAGLKKVILGIPAACAQNRASATGGWERWESPADCLFCGGSVAPDWDLEGQRALSS